MLGTELLSMKTSPGECNIGCLEGMLGSSSVKVMVILRQHMYMISQLTERGRRNQLRLTIVSSTAGLGSRSGVEAGLECYRDIRWGT